MRALLFGIGLGIAALLSGPAAALLGYADVVVDYFDSGAGPMAGPYGGEFPGGIGFPVPVPLSVVLGDDPGPTANFLSLPTGSYITVRFTDEIVVDGPGNDIFIQEVGAAGETANVFVSTDGIAFTFLGLALDSGTTAFDLTSIGFATPVSFVKIVGLDNFGGSPGFDVANVQGLPGSIQAVPEPTTLALLGLGLAGLRFSRRKQ